MSPFKPTNNPFPSLHSTPLSRASLTVNGAQNPLEIQLCVIWQPTYIELMAGMVNANGAWARVRGARNVCSQWHTANSK